MSRDAFRYPDSQASIAPSDKLEQSGTPGEGEDHRGASETLWLRVWLRCLSTPHLVAPSSLADVPEQAGAMLLLLALFAGMSPSVAPPQKTGPCLMLWYRNCREHALGLILMILRVLDSCLCHLSRAAVPSPGVSSAENPCRVALAHPCASAWREGWPFSADHPSHNVLASGGPRRGNRPPEWS
jgi:hypothetical protein